MAFLTSPVLSLTTIWLLKLWKATSKGARYTKKNSEKRKKIKTSSRFKTEKYTKGDTYDGYQDTNYSSCDLYIWQDSYFSSNNGCLIELIVMPTGTDCFMNAYWNDGREDRGIVTPGVFSTLDGGTEVMLNLEIDGSIILALDEMSAEVLWPVVG